MAFLIKLLDFFPCNAVSGFKEKLYRKCLIDKSRNGGQVSSSSKADFHETSIANMIDGTDVARLPYLSIIVQTAGGPWKLFYRISAMRRGSYGNIRYLLLPRS